MRILFLHDNFPAQFGLLGQYLSRNGWEVAFGAARKGAAMPGINVFNYAPHREISDKIHPYAAAHERAVLTGQAVARAALSLKKGGYSPDIIMAHSGWGPGLCVGEVWPDAKFVGYFELFYWRKAPDVVTGRLRRAIAFAHAHAPVLMGLAGSAMAICPTHFQKAQFPACFDTLTTVMHEGIDTEYHEPNLSVRLCLPNPDLSHFSEIATYAARGMTLVAGFQNSLRR